MALVSELIAVLTLDDALFKEKIAEDIAAADEMSTSIMGSGAVIAGAFAVMASGAILVTDGILKIAEKVDELYTSSNKLGMTVASMQELSIAAKETGVSTGSLESMLGFMNKSLGNAELGSGKAGDALKALGLNLTDLNGLSTDQKFEVIAQRLGQVHDVTLETALATQIFGRGAKDAIGLFNSNIDESITKARELGIELTQGQAGAAHELTATKDLVGSMFDGFLENVAADVAPAFTVLLNNILEAVKDMGGLKEAAQSVADFITAAMTAMVTAIGDAVAAMRVAKSIADDIGVTSILSKAGQGLEMAIKDVYSRITTPPAGMEALISHIAPQNLSDQSGIWGSSPSTAGVSSGANQGASITPQVGSQQMITASKAIAAYTDSTDSGKSAIDQLKTKALEAAGVLDSYNKLTKDMNAPGQSQSDSILKEGVASLKTQLAPTEQFQQIFDQILKLSKSTNGDAGTSMIPELMQKLQDIINADKTSSIGGEWGAGAHGVYDTSGLTTALNELKAYLGNKSNTEQTVQVSIKVDAGPDFITNVTKSTTFKQAVEQQFAETTQAAARGN